MDKMQRMKALVEKLNRAAYVYYQKSEEIMSNLEYDALYDELVSLEGETKTILSGSPTQRVGYEVVSALPKREHKSPMLSLDKTKNVDELKTWLGEQSALLSWKMDGLTIVLHYKNGKLEEAITRGNGYIGEEITNNAKAFANIPLCISYMGDLVLRGEAIIRYSDFHKINAQIEDIDAKYKNPRNLCSGSVRQLDAKVTKERNVHFYAFSLVQADGIDFHNQRKLQFDWLKEQGFSVVEYVLVNRDTLEEKVNEFSERIVDYDIPSDGLVLLFNDIAYGDRLGTTAKFPRNAIAFKWSDEQKETTLRYIEWSPSRTGLINPVAVFEPVELEGTTVSRASVHNVSIVEELGLGEGDIITVYKANMIIPQIADNLTRSKKIVIPKTCPACDQETRIKNDNGIKTLYCINPDCPVKQVKGFSLMVSRDALNIDGLSEMTLEKPPAEGYLHEKADIFHLEQYKEKIVSLDGFGLRSYEKLDQAIQKARKTTMPRLVYALGIAGIGVANAKVISRHFDDDIHRFMNSTMEELTEIDGIGEVLAKAIVDFFANQKHRESLEKLLVELEIEKTKKEGKGEKFAGMTFVITGSVEHFKNRKEMQEIIEANGGKVSSSVSAKTNYLINNDKESSSSKNKKAKELNIPILSEKDFLDLLEQ